MSAVLVIGGSDSSGGAGLARDLKTLSDLEVPALCALTAVTAQTDAAVLDVHVIPEATLRAQIAAAFASRAVAAVKVGMLATAASVHAVAESLAAHRPVPLVLDPVLVSSSGTALLDTAGRAALLEQLLPQAALITPNIPEAATLLGLSAARDEGDALGQAQQLLARGARAVLLKGGHAHGPECIDLLLIRDRPLERLTAPRQDVRMRGTGCALAAAIAGYLAQGFVLPEACASAKVYITALLQRRL